MNPTVAQPKNVIYGLSCKCHPERGTRYTGQTSEGAHTRFHKHAHAARSGKPWPVARWMAKHGVENISIEVLEAAENSADLDGLEEKWIIELGTMIADGGLNIRPGGNSSRGYKHGSDSKALGPRTWKHTPETIEKLRAASASHVGELGSNAKFTNKQVEEIKRRLWRGETSSDIAKDYGCRIATISYISTGDTWRTIPWPIGPRAQGRKGYFPKGSIPQNSKLNPAAVRNIRDWHAEGLKAKDLAELFGVTKENIGMIVRRKTWAWVE